MDPILVLSGASSSSKMDRKGVFEGEGKQKAAFENILNDQNDLKEPFSVSSKPKDDSISDGRKFVETSDDAGNRSALVTHEEVDVSEEVNLEELPMVAVVGIPTQLTAEPLPTLPRSIEEPSTIASAEGLITDDQTGEALTSKLTQLLQDVSLQEDGASDGPIQQNNTISQEGLESLLREEPRLVASINQLSLAPKNQELQKMTDKLLTEESTVQQEEGLSESLLEEITTLSKPVKMMDDGMPEVLEKPIPFKQMVDSLWIHQNLKVEVPLIETDSLTTTTARFSETAAVRNFVDDIRPLIEQVRATKLGGEMVVSMKPLELGKVRVELQVDKGEVRATLFAERSETRELLQSRFGELKSHLLSVGLKLEEVSVKEMPGSFSQREFSSQQERHSKHSHSENPRREASRDPKEFDDAWMAEGRMIA